MGVEKEWPCQTEGRVWVDLCEWRRWPWAEFWLISRHYRWMEAKRWDGTGGMFQTDEATYAKAALVNVNLGEKDQMEDNEGWFCLIIWTDYISGSSGKSFLQCKQDDRSICSWVTPESSSGWIKDLLFMPETKDRHCFLVNTEKGKEPWSTHGRK